MRIHAVPVSLLAAGATHFVDAGGTTTRMCDSVGDVLRGVAEALTVRDGVAACLIVCGVLAVARSEKSATTAS